MDPIRRYFMAAGLVIFAAAAAPAMAQERSGDITFTGGDIAAGVGISWGDGQLHYKGKTYPFTLSGLSVADVGIAKIDAAGDVYNLQRVEDFPGSYAAVSVGTTVAGGGALAAMENQNGVRIYIQSSAVGFKLNLSTDGVTIALK